MPGPPGTASSDEEKTAQQPNHLSRRKLLIGGAAATTLAAGAVALQQYVTRRGEPLRGPLTGDVHLGHLLRRAGFGMTAAELASYSSSDYSATIDRLLNYQQVSDDALEDRLKALNLDLNKPADQQRWWLLRMAWTQRPLLEKMTLFWHGHFATSYRKVGGPRAYLRMIAQNQFLREHAFDTFDALLLGITRDPAMLFYLDLTQSRKNAPNENYARELMELFTLGLGHYTQQDVSQGAAALTGWHVVDASTTAHYDPRDHNQAHKVYLGHSGNLDYRDVVRILANHPATPWFICRKLFTFFAYENPSDDDLRPMVETYTRSKHNMGEVMRALLHSPPFSSPKAYRSRLKSPVEFVVGTYRALTVQGDGRVLPDQMALMGQVFFDPPDVSGWPGDKVSTLWLNSGTWMARLNYLDLLLQGGAGAVDLQAIVNANAIDSPEHFVDYFAAFLLDGMLDQRRKEQLIEYFTIKDTMPDKHQITLASGQSFPRNRVRGTLYLLLASPEYQHN